MSEQELLEGGALRLAEQLERGQGLVFLALAGNVPLLAQLLRLHEADPPELDKALEFLGTLDGGMGTEQHQACMARVDALIDEHIMSMQEFRRGTGMVGDTFLAGGTNAQRVLGSG